jgi:hypothetical protein
MAAESCGTTVLNSVQRFEVLPVEATQTAVQEVRSSGADDIGHLQRRPVHGSMPDRRFQDERIERTGGRLQMPVRQVQVHGGRLQVAVPHQQLNRPQIDACLQQMSRE